MSGEQLTPDRARRLGSRRAARSSLFVALALCATIVAAGLVVVPVVHSSNPWSGSGGALGSDSSFAGTSASSASASIVTNALSTATAIPAQFWGVNAAARSPFGSSDGSAIAKTPVNYIRFPGGTIGEDFNYTSGVITLVSGTHLSARTTTAQFVTECKAIHCHAIFQLPAEINQPQTAAFYANYVVHTLGFQPAYWEIGNAPSGWVHYNLPWSKWSSTAKLNITPVPFANLVQRYITAVRAVDSGAQFIALGAGMGPKNYDESWVKTLASTDGKELAGISVHSYIMGGGPSNPTDQELFANLQGKYSLVKQVTADRQYILAACSTCTNVKVFVTEINAAELSTYDQLLTSFAGTLYLAAETVQGLQLKATNLDWFCYDCAFPGAWSQHPLKWQMQYYLFSDVLVHLEKRYLPAKVSGPSSFYAAATYLSTKGLALLMVNVNTTTSVTVNIANAGMVVGSTVTQYYWTGATTQPSSSSTALKSSITLPPESIVLLVAPPSGVV